MLVYRNMSAVQEHRNREIKKPPTPFQLFTFATCVVSGVKSPHLGGQRGVGAQHD